MEFFFFFFFFYIEGEVKMGFEPNKLQIVSKN